MRIENPLNPGVKQPIQTVLRLLASQDGCDGEPYDQMMQAADYIDRLENSLHKVHLAELFLTKGSYIELYTTDRRLIWLKLFKGIHRYYFQSDCGRQFSIDEVTQLLESSELRVHCGQCTGMCALIIAGTTTIWRFV